MAPFGSFVPNCCAMPRIRRRPAPFRPQVVRDAQSGVPALLWTEFRRATRAAGGSRHQPVQEAYPDFDPRGNGCASRSKQTGGAGGFDVRKGIDVVMPGAEACETVAARVQHPCIAFARINAPAIVPCRFVQLVRIKNLGSRRASQG